MRKTWLLRALLLLLAATERAAVTVTTPGLSIVFNDSTAAPVSVKNAKGEELLDMTSPQAGFYMQQSGNKTTVPFDQVKEVGTNELIFSVAATGQQIGWVFGGAGHYLTANCTRTRGFERALGGGDSDGNFVVYFALASSALHGIGLNFMVYDFTAEAVEEPHPGVHILYEAPWVSPSSMYSKWNPPARFGVYEMVDSATEDETLFDFWVDEGLPHPRVPGVWDRPTAKAWLKAWIAAQYDMSNFAMVPGNLSEWRKFIPLAKKADAKVGGRLHGADFPKNPNSSIHTFFLNRILPPVRFQPRFPTRCYGSIFEYGITPLSTT